MLSEEPPGQGRVRCVPDCGQGLGSQGRTPRRLPRFAPTPAQTSLAVTPQHAWAVLAGAEAKVRI